MSFDSLAIFSGLLKHDFALFQRSRVCGLSFSYLTNFVCNGHTKASSDVAARILGGPQHPLFNNKVTHAHRKPFQAATLKDIYPAQSRFLVDRDAELNYYIQKLS